MSRIILILHMYMYTIIKRPSQVVQQHVHPLYAESEWEHACRLPMHLDGCLKACMSI